jgi:protease stability complex PrcB-like protein
MIVAAPVRPENTKTRKIAMYGFRALVVSWLAIMTGSVAMSAQDATAPRTIEKGDQSNIDEAKQVLVQTDAEWTRLWSQHSPDHPRPRIDFSKEMVVGVFMGSRPSAGFGTAIVSTTAGNGTLIVRYTEKRPGPGSVTAQILTFPYHLVAIPKASVTDVKFEEAP